MTKAPLGQMIIELGLDSTDFGKGLQSAKREVRTWSSDMQASMRAADFAGDKIAKLQSRYDGLTKVIEAQQKVVDRTRQSYENSFVDGKATAQTEKLAGQLKNAESQLISYNQQLRDTAGDLAKLKVQTEGFTGGMRTFGKGLQTAGGHMTTWGDRLTKSVTAPLIAGTTLVAKAASDWESSWAGVVKTNDEVVDKNGNVVYSLAELESGLRAMTKELPATHSEIAGVAEAAGQLGIETQNVTSFTKTMIDMGESTNLAAETAAESLARFANITGMSQTDFDRLGSSIVALGNNFATTEADIVALAMRLAGAGSQIGLSEADIMGLAAALSSVGIEAEMGGSALSKTMINMAVATETGYKSMNRMEELTGLTRRELELMSANSSKEFKALADSMNMTAGELNKIVKAGGDLKGFANIAGMTSEQFVKAFQEDAVGALGAFIEGLGSAEEQGTSAIALLDELGISEVRLRDSLLRAGNASELFADSIKMSSEAWEENTALTDEASVRYETLESQLGMLRNEAVDMAINLGGPVVKALREGLQAAEPFIKGVSELAEAFADADEKTQQSILKMVGFGIAAGPVIGTVGRFSTGIGNATVKTIDFMAEMAKKKAVADFGSTALTASGAKGVGAMIPTLGTLNPLLLGLVGAGGVLALGYGAWKLWGEEAYEAGQRTKRWGADVDEATNDVLNDIQETSGVFNLLKQGVGQDSALMIGDFQKMGQSIENDINRRLEITNDFFGSLPDNLRNSLQEILGDHHAHMEETLALVESNNAEISRIQQTASNENRELNAEELAYIQELQRHSADEYIQILNLNAEEEKAIRSALAGDIDDISREQTLNLIARLNEEQKELNTTRLETVESTKALIKELGLENTEIGRQMLASVEKYYKAMGITGKRTMYELYQLYPELAETHDLATGNMLSNVDMAREKQLASNRALIASWEEYGAAVYDESGNVVESQTMIVNNSRVGAETWNRIVAESGGNMDVFKGKIFEAVQTAEGWNHIRFQMHEANLDSNAKEIILEAAVQNGYWDGMAWKDKELLLNDRFSETTYRALENLSWWNKATAEEKFAILTNEFSGTVIQGLIDIGKWDGLDPEIQELIAKTNSPEILIQTLRDIGVWERLSPEVHDLLLNNAPAQKVLDSTTRKLNDYDQIDVDATLRATDNTKSGVESARRAINSLPDSKTTVLRTQRVTDVITRHSEYNVSQGIRPLYAEGTNYHPGGPAIVNDQSGPIFRELVVEPDGTSYIPHGRNVLIPQLSRGAKVLRAALTKQRFPGIPQYASGIGNIPVESTVIQNIRNTRSTINEGSAKNIQIETLLREVIRRLEDIRNKNNITEINQTNHIHGEKISERELAKENKIFLERLAYKAGLI